MCFVGFFTQELYICIYPHRLQELSEEHDPDTSPSVPPISEDERHHLRPPPPSGTQKILIMIT